MISDEVNTYVLICESTLLRSIYYLKLTKAYRASMLKIRAKTGYITTHEVPDMVLGVL